MCTAYFSDSGWGRGVSVQPLRQTPEPEPPEADGGGCPTSCRQTLLDADAPCTQTLGGLPNPPPMQIPSPLNADFLLADPCR